jgi:hypothetical protein
MKDRVTSSDGQTISQFANRLQPENHLRGPIFIGGLDRCGKTTMQAFLSSHPNIAIPAVGSNFWSYFYGQYGDLRIPENFERCLAALMHYKHALYLQPDPERIRKEFWQGSPTYASLFGLLHQHYAERTGKTRWGDQTGLIERYADQVLAAYPGAKMIHMIRDPRDRYEASIAMWPNGKGRCGGATARWKYSVALMKRNLSRYPDRYLPVQYERLVRQPEKTMHNVCEFIGESYTPAMLSMDGSPGHREKLIQNAETSERPLSEKYIGRFRQHVPKPEIAFIQQYAKDEMGQLGYAIEPIRFSLRERVQYEISTRPANLGRMIVWLLVESLQQRFPRLTGRRPSDAMVLRSGRAGTVKPTTSARQREG